MVILINGLSGVGKDSFVRACQEVNRNVYNISTIEYVKHIAGQCGWRKDKTHDYRMFLSELKALMNKYNNYANVICMKDIDNVLENNKNAIILVHIRETKDFHFYKDKYNAKTLLIKNYRISEITNDGDKSVFDWNYDYIINNDGDLNILQENAKEFMKGVS